MRRLLGFPLFLLLTAPPALAEEQAALPGVEPASANSDTEKPADIARDPTAAPTPAPAAIPAVAEQAPLPPVAVVASPAQAASDELEGKIGASVRMSGQATSPFPVDAEASQVRPNPFETRLRIEPQMRYGGFGLLGDLQTTTGAVIGTPSETLVGGRTPHPSLAALELRELFLEYRGKAWMLRAGQQAANWGLGLIASSGARDPQAGEGFGDARFGDLSYRVMVAGRPFYELGGGWRGIEPVLAADMVVRDDTANYWAGDRAIQGVVALRFKVDEDRQVGVYTVVRQQRSALAEDTRGTDAVVVDVAGKWQWKARQNVLSAGFELVSIGGTSTMARSTNASVHQIRQFGGALKGSLKVRQVQFYLDAGYASGDQNPFDDKLEGFRFDPDFQVGLVLFDEVLGYQTARTSQKAADPAIVGRGPDGVELLPTLGSVTGAAYLFPRVRYGLADWADLYGGPLFAFATAKLTDPYATQVGGGDPRNALGGSSGTYLGTELDLGAQARFKPHPAVLVTATLEGGLLVPGTAFSTASGGAMSPVGVGRLRLGVNL